ncbi:MAG: RNA polymerase sigma-70 factor [Cyclobacteriaceae bacterium]|nr:RNA polymerase sigma-70 factor [Cyclobacteriaceae bacterium SS2]
MELIERFKTGDKNSLNQLFHQYFHRLCAFCHQYINDVAIAEDIVQDTFISLWDKRTDFTHPQALKSFLYTTVRNKCLNHIKHQLVVQKHESSVIHELHDDEDFSRRVIEEEVFGQLYEEIKALPEGAHKIMALVLKGLKNREIAEILGISENTVKTQKKIAYARLKAKLDPVLYDFLLTF